MRSALLSRTSIKNTHVLAMDGELFGACPQKPRDLPSVAYRGSCKGKAKAKAKAKGDKHSHP